MKGIKKLLSNHVEQNLPKYILVLIIFVTGLCIGIGTVIGNREYFAGTFTEDIRLMCNQMYEGDYNTSQVFKTSLFKNIRYFAFAFLGGLSLWLIPFALGVLLVMGFSFGLTLAGMTVSLGATGFAIGFVSLALNFLIAVPVYTVLAVTAFNNALSRRSGRYQRSDFAGYSICFFVLFLLILPVILADTFPVPEIIKSICGTISI